MKTLVSSAILAVVPVALQADVTQCHEIEDSMDRLACYDQQSEYAPERVEVSGVGNWRVISETSQIDDSTNVYLSLASDDNTNCRYDTEVHRLHIACRENTTSLWVTFGGCFMSSIQGKGRITYRLDQEPAAKASFRESNDNMALGLWSGGQAIPFVKRMLGHEKLLIRATPFSDSRVTGEYDIRGIEEAIKPLREACNW
ncbi:type VI secretion system-associated protein TagO [Rhodovulum sulfidophilum]|uniref:type VI secretion system-associated protein TagO n=1 Tax=Rhodovulum sulfidophilum TaxID=35806 RepID=UPI001923AD4E|nr:type VI secretion system-associated protein TagO [Rhodovulum sulfidophilum]MBL3562230.1 hypothetical protein [Rhodovulum sulfidophilum]